MYARKTLFHPWGALDRGRFNAGVLFVAGAFPTLALIVLDGQTGGHISGGSFAAHLLLMLALALCLIPLTLRRCLDLGWSVPKAWLAVAGSFLLFPLLTLVFMGLPGRTAVDGDVAPLPKPMIVAAPVLGVLLALLVSLVFSRLP